MSRQPDHIGNILARHRKWLRGSGRHYETHGPVNSNQAAYDRADLLRLLGFDRPWPLISVLRRLADAADHLNSAHDCDMHGYEEVREAAAAAREILRDLAPEAEG